MNYDLAIEQLDKLFDPVREASFKKNNVLEKSYGIASIINNLNLNFQLIKTLRKSECEIQPFITLSRMMVDNYSILYLLTSHSSNEEQELRYFLFLLDSIKTKSETIKNFRQNIKTHLPNIVLENADHASNRDDKAFKQIMNYFERNKIGATCHKSIIDNLNWKFKNLNQPNSRQNSFKWSELYQVARIPHYFADAIQNYYSGYVHGLGLTIAYRQDKNVVQESVLSFLFLVVTLTCKILSDIYFEEIRHVPIDAEYGIFMTEIWNMLK